MLSSCDHVMRVDLEQKIPLESSSRDEGGPFGIKKFPWGHHHVMRVDLLGTKNSRGVVIT